MNILSQCRKLFRLKSSKDVMNHFVCNYGDDYYGDQKCILVIEQATNQSD